MSWQARLPPSVNDLLQRLGVDPATCARSDGRFTIDVADCGRVDLVPAQGQWVILDAVIGPVDPDPIVRRRQLEKLLRLSSARMQSHPEIVALSPDGEMLHLQTYIEAALSPVQLEDALGNFFNAMAVWRTLGFSQSSPARPALRGMP